MMLAYPPLAVLLSPRNTTVSPFCRANSAVAVVALARGVQARSAAAYTIDVEAWVCGCRDVRASLRSPGHMGSPFPEGPGWSPPLSGRTVRFASKACAADDLE